MFALPIQTAGRSNSHGAIKYTSIQATMRTRLPADVTMIHLASPWNWFDSCAREATIRVKTTRTKVYDKEATRSVLSYKHLHSSSYRGGLYAELISTMYHFTSGSFKTSHSVTRINSMQSRTRTRTV